LGGPTQRRGGMASCKYIHGGPTDRGQFWGGCWGGGGIDP